MQHIICEVEKGSIADQLGIRPGDYLLAINGQNVVDWLDYQAFCCTEKLSLITRRDDEEIVYELEKDEYEPLGLKFDSQLMSRVRDCVNHCMFCFVDQLPDHVRPTLRVKDDDWRLSMMMGNYVTLTNVSDKELERIVARHASPLYISVHATDPELRAKLLGQKLGAKLMQQLTRLREGGIQFHAQAVLCPNLNDGKVLEKTVEDLAALWPCCRSLALVPVGLTGHREGLCPLRKYTREEAAAVIDAAEVWQERFLREFDTVFVYPSDEFYLQAGRDVPPDSFYGDYDQIENGVGLVRLLRTEFEEALGYADFSTARPAHLVIATGVSAGPILEALLSPLHIPGVKIDVIPIENHFFGPSVTVTGLLTGGDLIRVLKDYPCDKVLITERMLRETEDVFLDDMTLDEVREKLGRPVVKVGTHGDELLEAILHA